MQLAASFMLMDRDSRRCRVSAIGAAVCVALAGAFPAEAHFAAKSQQLDWARSAGGTSFDIGRGIATDHRGNSYVTGGFSGTSTFGVGDANQTELTSAGSLDVFVAKYAQDGTLVWARTAGGSSDDEGWDIATDHRGNSYVTGGFSGTATFGAGEAHQTELTSAGDDDVFVAKYAQDGTLLWARTAGGTSFDIGRGIATDHRGNSYVTGWFHSTATFGLSEANQTELTSAGIDDEFLDEDADVFVAKYTRDGTLLWARSDGGVTTDFGFAIATDHRGNSYVTGLFTRTATFGAGEANQTELTSVGLDADDVFLAKYTGDGTLLWARSAGGGADFDRGLGIATDHRGNSYVTGLFDLTATFGAGEANQTELTSAGIDDVFVAKYTRDGTLLWARSAGGTDVDAGLDIATDRRGHSYVIGVFSFTATFGAGEPNQTELTSAGGNDVFVAKYARDGNLLWARTAGGTSFDEGSGIATDHRGNSYVTGGFSGTSTFGVGDANQTDLTSAGGASVFGADVFVAKYREVRRNRK